MAHPQQKREEARRLYVFEQLLLETIAQVIDVPLATLRAWKTAAKNKGDDWDKFRAASLKAGGGERQVAHAVYVQLMMLLENTITELQQQQDLDVLEKAKTLTGLGDTLSKTTALGARLMPEVNRLAVASEVIREFGDFVREQHPEQALAFVELLGQFAPTLQEKFG